MEIPYLIFSDKKGNIYHHPFLRMLGLSLDDFVLPKREELIELPLGSSLFYLPSRLAVGYDIKAQNTEVLSKFEGQKVFAVGATLIPAYLRLYTPASMVEKKKILPLWAYTACGFYKGKFYVAAKRIDGRIRQSPRFYDSGLVAEKVKSFIAKHPKNRLYKYLANCAINYNCLAAKNLFLERWEAPLPTSRVCNAKCRGCLSYQDKARISSHQRINFKPKVSEVVEVMGHHLKTAREAIVSFGQGCEGEPLLQADLIAESVRCVRGEVSRGTINVNTNASIPSKVKLLCDVGVDSFRVSLNSPRQKFYDFYFKPLSYKFRDVIKSIKIAKKYKKFVSVNLFVFPGFSDAEQEQKSLIKLIKDTGIDMVQMRNLNIDHDYYLSKLDHKNLRPQGILHFLKTIRGEFPNLKIGYFNVPKERF